MKKEEMKKIKPHTANTSSSVTNFACAEKISNLWVWVIVSGRRLPQEMPPSARLGPGYEGVLRHERDAERGSVPASDFDSRSDPELNALVHAARPVDAHG